MTYLCHFLWREINLKRSIRIMLFWRTHVQSTSALLLWNWWNRSYVSSDPYSFSYKQWMNIKRPHLFILPHFSCTVDGQLIWRIPFWDVRDNTWFMSNCITSTAPVPPVGQAATRSISDKVDLEATTKWLGAPLNVHTCSYIIFN